MKVETWKVKDIQVGQRTRKRCTEIGPLAESIQNVGLLSPIVIDDSGFLLAGQRRLEACKFLGWAELPCTVVSLKDEATPLKVEHDENVCRVPFAKSELTSICHRIMVIEKQKAKTRQLENLKTGEEIPRSGTVPERDQGDARDKVGAALGISGKTAGKLADLGEAAEQSPELYGDLPELADTQGVKAAHKELQKRQGKKKKKVKPAKIEAKDQLGNVVPDSLRDVFNDPQLNVLIDHLLNWRETCRAEAWSNQAAKLYDHYPFTQPSKVKQHLENALTEVQHAADALSCGVPYTVCPKCSGETCSWCRKSGCVPQWRYEEK